MSQRWEVFLIVSTILYVIGIFGTIITLYNQSKTEPLTVNLAEVFGFLIVAPFSGIVFLWYRLGDLMEWLKKFNIVNTKPKDDSANEKSS